MPAGIIPEKGVPVRGALPEPTTRDETPHRMKGAVPVPRAHSSRGLVPERVIYASLVKLGRSHLNRERGGADRALSERLLLVALLRASLADLARD